jgi:hypothetical protein
VTQVRALNRRGALLVRESADPVGSSPLEDLDALVHELKADRLALAATPVDAIIAILAAAGKAWMDPKHRLHRTVGGPGLNYLVYYLSRRNLEEVADLALRGDRRHLDGFRPLKGGVRLRAQPRGLCVHWLAGNVAAMGMLSVVQSLLAKNANLVRVPTEQALFVPTLLAALGEIEVEHDGRAYAGSLLARACTAVHFPREAADAHTALSLAADVRVAWGGREAVESVLNLPRRYGTEDLVFGPKYSFSVVGGRQLQDEEAARAVAKALAADASQFDQQACSCPHTVFVEKGKAVTGVAFAALLADELAKALKRYPRGEITAGDATAVTRVRSLAGLTEGGRVFASSGPDYTVVFEPGGRDLAEPVFNRVLFVREWDDLEAVASLADHFTQTVGLALDEEQAGRLANLATLRGVERCPRIGQANQFDQPWDGVFPIDRLVRWVSVTEGARQ